MSPIFSKKDSMVRFKADILESRQPADIDYELTVGHWYLCRVDVHYLSVLQFKGHVGPGGKPQFELGQGEPGPIGPNNDVLVISHFGTEEP